MTHLACEIVEDFHDPDQQVTHEANLGIQIDDDMVVIKLGQGQCKHRGVELGDQLHGMNGVSMAECVMQAFGDEAELDAKSAADVLIKTPKPYTLNFNGMPEVEEAKEEMDDTFAALLKQGIQVNKQHRNGSIFNKMAKRILYTNEGSDTIFVGKTKNTPTNKVFKVSEVENVGYSQNSPNQIILQTKDAKDDLTVKLPSAKSNESFAQNLHKHLSMHNEKAIAHEGPLSPKSFRSGGGAPISPASP